MKFCKNWPSWLKGGICAVIIVVVYVILLLILSAFSGGFAELGGKIVISIPLWLALTLMPALKSDYIAGIFMMWLITPIFWFIVGAIIGLIYGKLKK